MNYLKEVFGLFLRLGLTAFGGPAAHIAMMRHEIVVKKQWMDNAQFINLVGLTNLIPGPNSTELAIHIGKERAGWRGLLIAGLCFIFPAVIITLVIAWLYKEYGMLPQVQPFIYGIRPAVIAIILMAVFPLAKATVKNTALAVTASLALVLALLGVQEILVMFGLAMLYLMFVYCKSQKKVLSFLPALAVPAYGAISNTGLFLVFLKIGTILYGSGYVLFAFIDEELVVTGILQRRQLMDAISVGQFTPGPVFSSVTFIGYQINGLPGAFAATLGVFMPSFLFVGLLSYFKKRMLNSVLFSAFLDAVNAAAVAVIVAVCFEMGKESIVSWETIFIAVSGLFILWKFPKINSAYMVLFGSLLGYLFSLL